LLKYTRYYLEDLPIFMLDNAPLLLLRHAFYLINVITKYINCIYVKYYQLFVNVSCKNIFFLSYFFKNNFLTQFTTFADLAVKDILSTSYRFNCYYVFLTYSFFSRFVIETSTDELVGLPSLYFLYNSANWIERECWDMFGIFFHSHPDLRRLLNDYGFQGFPLRKDFPLTGYYEIYFNDYFQIILFTPVVLAQELRFFYFQKSWS